MAPRKHSKPSPALVASENGELSTPTPTTRANALVFVSHDSRDADLAEAFANLLSDVSGGTLKSFRSSDKKGTGIEFGAEWYTAIMSQLDDATDVVALLTAQSIDRPWILYEAGVAKGKLETTVFGIAVGVPLEKVSTGPFGQFQNCGDDEDSLTTLVVQLLRRNPDAAPREEAVKGQVRVFRQNVERILKTRGKPLATPPASGEQNAAKLFEEIKAMVRELPERIDQRTISASRRSPARRFHPGMIDEMVFHPFLGEKAGMAYAWLVVLSFLPDDVPWLYEPGMDFYRALQRGKPQEIQKAREVLIKLIKFTDQSKFMYRFLRENDESAFSARHLSETIFRFLRNTVTREIEEDDEEDMKIIRKDD
jgi:hypothetical protein